VDRVLVALLLFLLLRLCLVVGLLQLGRLLLLHPIHPLLVQLGVLLLDLVCPRGRLAASASAVWENSSQPY
jgi:hypothetical protein